MPDSTPMTHDELVACPFCDGGNVCERGDDGYISCADCHAYGPEGGKQAWNARPATEQMREEIAGLRSQAIRAIEHIDCRSELYTSDAALIASLRAILSEALAGFPALSSNRTLPPIAETKE